MGPDAIMAGEDAAETWYVRARGRVLGPIELGPAPGVARAGAARTIRPGLARPPELGGGRHPGATLPAARARAGRSSAARERRPRADAGPRAGVRSAGFLILDDDDDAVRPAPRCRVAGPAGPAPTSRRPGITPRQGRRRARWVLRVEAAGEGSPDRPRYALLARRPGAMDERLGSPRAEPPLARRAIPERRRLAEHPLRARETPGRARRRRPRASTRSRRSASPSTPSAGWATSRRSSWSRWPSAGLRRSAGGR